jgi:hypothetical protein
MKSERVDSSQMSLMFEDYSESPTAEAIDTEREEEEREDAKLDREIDEDEAGQPRAFSEPHLVAVGGSGHHHPAEVTHEHEASEPAGVGGDHRGVGAQPPLAG